MQKIGIIGGTFDPVHLGHLIIAEYFAEDMSLDRCFFVPANISPFKTEECIKSSTEAADRVEMLKLAIADNSRFKIETIELVREGVSYTIDTIKYFRLMYPDDELFLLIGKDNIIKFDEWKNWQEILRMTQICVSARDINYNAAPFLEKLTIDGKSPIIINSPKIEISSSEIRNRISQGKSIKYLVPPAVEKYIYDKSLYKIR